MLTHGSRGSPCTFRVDAAAVTAAEVGRGWSSSARAVELGAGGRAARAVGRARHGRAVERGGGASAARTTKLRRYAYGWLAITVLFYGNVDEVVRQTELRGFGACRRYADFC